MNAREALMKKLSLIEENRPQQEVNDAIVEPKGWMAPAIINSGEMVTDIDGSQVEARYMTGEHGLPYVKMSERQAIKMALELKIRPPICVDGLWMSMFLLTPGHSKWLLKHFCKANRTPNPQQLLDLKNEIKSGNWWLVHQGMAFLPHEWKDGQHRGVAAYESGYAIPMTACLNLLPGAIESIDIHARRSVFNMSQMRGDTGDKLITQSLSAIAKVVLNNSPDFVEKFGTSPLGVKRLIDEQREKLFRKVEIQLKKSHFKGVSNGNVKGAIVKYLKDIKGDRALVTRLEEFMEVLSSGISHGVDDSAAVVLGKKLGQIKKNSAGQVLRIKPGDQYLLTLKAISKFVERAHVQNLSLTAADRAAYAAMSGPQAINKAKVSKKPKKEATLDDEASSEE